MRARPLRIRNDGCPTPLKLGYESRVEAKRVLKTGRHKRRTDSQLRVYRCDCGLWHLGNSYGGMSRDGIIEVVRGCAKRFAGNPCAFPAEHPVQVGAVEVWLCDLHRRELLGRAAELRKDAA